MGSIVKANRSELALLRGKRNEKSLQEWTKAFGGGDRRLAERYAQAASSYIGGGEEGASYLGQLSPNTRKAYAFALTEFFEWVAQQHGRVIAPHDVTRKDAEDYVAWLANRPYSLTEEKLKDGDKNTELALFEVVKQAAKPVGVAQVVKELPRDELANITSSSDQRVVRQDVSKLLRHLVLMDVLEAAPTLDELHKTFPEAGIRQFEFLIGGKTVQFEDLFTYVVKQSKPLARSSIALRVAALSSFWKSLTQGENTSGGDALLRYDIWAAVKKRVSRGLAPEKRQAARGQKVPSEVIVKMLSYVPSKPTLGELRNRAMIYLLVFAGLRVDEIIKLRRGIPTNPNMPYFDGSEPPALQLIRKGGKKMRLPFPPVALKPLIEFQMVLDSRAAGPDKQYDNPNREGYLPRTSPAWWYRDLQLPEAPLFPAIRNWGKNKRPDYRKSMSRVFVYKMLQEWARAAGVPDELAEKVHPHAFRHFSANAMVEGGKDLREVQHMLGHTSITTTEGYLEDIQDEVKLSGQHEILKFLDVQGATVEPVHVDKPKRTTQPEVIDTYSIPVEDDEPDLVSDEELAELMQLSEVMPANTMPVPPPFEAPEVKTVQTRDGEVVEDDEKLIGIDGQAEELLEELVQTKVDGMSPGSPDWVYSAMARGEGQERVIFNRGGDKDRDWIVTHYPKIPERVYGVGQESLLPWYVRAPGNIKPNGYFKDVAPLPLLSPEQVSSETVDGDNFITKLEARYHDFANGDPANGVLPSPMRSVGLVRWFGFFAYHSKKFTNSFVGAFGADVPTWMPWESLIVEGDLRSHDDDWVIDWIADNAHTYRTTVDAMKRGVLRSERGSDETGDQFLVASFEGADLFTKLPDWMVEDDPVKSMDAKERKDFFKWLRNVTGQAVTTARDVSREEQGDVDEKAKKVRIESIRDQLKMFYQSISAVEEEKRAGGRSRSTSSIEEERANLRTMAAAYAMTAAGVKKLSVPMNRILTTTTTEFNKIMDEEYLRLGIPNPNSETYRKVQGVDNRIEAIVRDLFPNEEVLADANLFADSELFNPKWFRIDEKNQTLYVDEDEVEEIQRTFGQDPLLLVRRAARAMWEARDKKYDVLWGVMMSYFSAIVPTGREMESDMRGIPTTSVKGENRALRKEWLSSWVDYVKDLASGKALKEVTKGRDLHDPEVREELRERSKVRSKDAQDRADRALDFASLVSVDVWQERADIEEKMLAQIEEGRLKPNRRRSLLPNGKGTFLHLEGEKPQGWYKVDLFGAKEGEFRANAPPRFMSPGALYLVKKEVEPVEALLPSPFKMIAAMNLA